MVLALLFLSHLALADQAVDGDSATPVPPMYVPTNLVERELQCVALHSDSKAAIRSRQANQVIPKLSAAMTADFERLKFTPLERALFYAQVIEESGGFTQLSESLKMSRAGGDAIGQLISEDENADKFHQKKASKIDRHWHPSHDFGQFRGRGLLQITGCTNFFSVNNWLNLWYAGKPTEWKAYWEIHRPGTLPDQDDIIQVPAIKCTEAQKDVFNDEYRLKTGMNANLYDTLNEPRNYAMIGMELEDPVSGKKMASEQFMVDVTMAYWKGRCGALLDHIGAGKSAESFPLCDNNVDFLASEDRLARASKCLTYCIRGHVDSKRSKDKKGKPIPMDFEKRHDWFKITSACTKKNGTAK